MLRREGETDTDLEEETMGDEAEMMSHWPIHRPVTAKNHQRPQEAQRVAWDRFSLAASRRNQHFWCCDFRILASRAMRGKPPSSQGYDFNRGLEYGWRLGVPRNHQWNRSLLSPVAKSFLVLFCPWQLAGDDEVSHSEARSQGWSSYGQWKGDTYLLDLLGQVS